MKNRMLHTKHLPSSHDVAIRRREKADSSKKIYQPPLPYLSRPKQDKQTKDYKKFLEHIKTLKTNIIFIEVVAQIPKYAKFLKRLLTNHKQMKEASIVILKKIA